MCTMDQGSEELWQAVYAAYEARDAEEARRLLNTGKAVVDCRLLQHCADEDYLRWLLHHQLIFPTEKNEETERWPGLQEKQLQCDTLPEPQRPGCILNGEWHDES